MTTDLADSLSPASLMDPRGLGALQPTRLSASRSFIDKMIRQGWQIEKENLTLDARGNGQARYSINTPKGSITFLAYLREPAGGNRTSRIIGTSWDMIGALIDGDATDEQVSATEQEIPKLYEGRAPEGTLVWFRSNQSLRIFSHVRESLAHGCQPNPRELKSVGYLMRNTGLDGNGTFGTTSFAGIPRDHPLKTSYHAQMLAAYLMRELAVDVVEELARIDAPKTAVTLDPAIKQFIGVGNGSALGLVMFVYNRPILINAYISAYVEAINYVLTNPDLGTVEDFRKLEYLLDKTIRYRALDDTAYRVFSGSKEIASDLRRVRSTVRAARRGEIARKDDETILAAVHRHIRGAVTREAVHSLNALMLELVPEYCDRLIDEYLVFEEHLDLDPQLSITAIKEILRGKYQWALRMPLNDSASRDRVWYQSRAAEEPRSGPREEVPEAHEVIPSYPQGIKDLMAVLDSYEVDLPIGRILAEHPSLEYITRLVVALADKPYAVPHADPHDADFVPVWLVRLMNSFIHGLDRTEDYLGRTIRGLIFEGAPFREELESTDASDWWWSYRSTTALDLRGANAKSAVSTVGAVDDTVPPSGVALDPVESAMVAPDQDAESNITTKFREARLMAGRAYQALNVPEGSWHGARDFYITALVGNQEVPEILASRLRAAIDDETGKAPAWCAPTFSLQGTKLCVDNHNQSGLLTGHILINLLGALPSMGIDDFEIRNIYVDGCTPGLKLGLARYGMEVSAEDNGVEMMGIVHPAQDDQASRQRYWRALEDFMRHGQTHPARVFWEIYYRANAGLYPDTPISRQHTGATVKDVLKPGQQLTKLFAEEELLILLDPDDADNHDPRHFGALAAR